MEGSGLHHSGLCTIKLVRHEPTLGLTLSLSPSLRKPWRVGVTPSFL